jgi:hypothetical protein
MFSRMRNICVSFLLVMSVIFCAGSGANAEDAAWQVSKLSGEVSVITSGVQQAALTDGAMLKPGDSIRTGQTGRVLLMRGEESILVSPNSVIGIPKAQINGMSTTIIQQAGSILLDVEKRNVKYFEVETPFLAAVVKGTKFRVTVDKNNSNVDVLRGQVEVTDLKSGQIATVLPGQTASVLAQDQGGLSLSGSGTLSPIQQGAPRKSSVTPLTVATEDLVSPESTANGPKVREALALGERVSIPVLSGANAANASMWNSGHSLSRSDEGYSNRWLTRNSNLNVDLAFPFGIGVVVAVGVAAQRRRQRQKQMQPPRPK